MGEDSDIKMAIRYLREVSILLLVAQVLTLVRSDEGLYLINLTMAGVSALAAVFIKLIPTASLLAQLGREFNLLGRLIKYCYWSSLAFQGFALPLLLAGGVSSYDWYLGLELEGFTWLVKYLALILQPSILAVFVLLTSPLTANFVGVLGLRLSLTASFLVLVGWLGILLLLCKLSSVTDINDFQTSAKIMAVATLFSLPFVTGLFFLSVLFWMAACYKLWLGASKALMPVVQIVKQAEIVRESEVEKILNEIKFLESIVKEYEGYLLKLKEKREKGEVTDEVYQDLKNMYIEELEKNRSKLEELKKKLEEEKGTQVKTMRIESVDLSALPETEHTIVYTAASTTVSIQGENEALPKAAKHLSRRRRIGTEVRPAEMRKITEELEGPPFFLFLLFVFITLASITLAVILDPLFSIIVFVLLVIAIAVGYHMGSKNL